MASQSSYRKTIFSTGGSAASNNNNNSFGMGGGNQNYFGMGGMNITNPGMGGIGISKSTNYDVVVDPYNNKYYGEENKNTFLKHFQSQINSIQQTLAKGYTESVSQSPWGWFGGSNRSYLTDADKATYKQQMDDYTKQMNDFDANYVQSNKFFASYNAYQNDWNNFFEASYRNPRAEAEQKQALKTQTDQYRARAEDEANRQQLFAANNSLEISPPRTTGTGVSSSKDTATNGLRVNGGTGLGL